MNAARITSITSIPPEQTGDLDAARRALAESRRDAKRTDAVVADTAATLERVREVYEANNFTAKFRAIIRGNT